MIRFMVDKENGEYLFSLNGDLALIATELAMGINLAYSKFFYESPISGYAFSRLVREAITNPASPVWDVGSVEAQFAAQGGVEGTEAAKMAGAED